MDYLQAIDEWWPTRWNAAVALRDGVLIGWSEYSLDRDDPHRAEIGVCVADTEQGLGVGTALVSAVVVNLFRTVKPQSLKQLMACRRNACGGSSVSTSL